MEPTSPPATLETFWVDQLARVARLEDFKTHSLPLARIKKIVKADKEVKLVSSEVIAVLAHACELFILEITLRSWNNIESRRRCTLQRSNLAAAISKNEIFDFLVDIVPKEEPPAPLVVKKTKAAPATEPVPCFYFAPQFQADDLEFDFMSMLQDPADVAAWQKMLAEKNGNFKYGGSSAGASGNRGE